MSSYSPWCAIPFAPGVRSRCRPVTCASRCERRVAPRSPAPRPSPPCGLPFLPGARFPSHLESVSTVGQSLALPGAREESHLGAHPACWLSEWPSRSPWCAIPFAPGVRSRCRPVTCASRCVRRVAPRSPPRVPVLRVAFPFFQVRDSPSHLEPEMADIQ